MTNTELSKKLTCYGRKTVEEENEMRASVLIPLVSIGGADHLLFQVRSSKLNWQPGDISFPGGKFEDEDISPAATAIRECCEELGIRETDIEYIGALDRILSPIGVKLHPFVGRLKTIEWNPNNDEVEALFTVPLDTLLNMEPLVAEMQAGTRPIKNFPFDLLPHISKEWRVRRNYEVYFYSYTGHVIWGLTALVLKNFLDVYRK